MAMYRLFVMHMMKNSKNKNNDGIYLVSLVMDITTN